MSFKPRWHSPPVPQGGRSFNLSDRITIVANASKTRNGFKHTATLYIDGVEVDSAKVNYLNRTWESYEFQTVMQKLVDSTNAISDEEKSKAKSFLNKDQTDRTQFETIGRIAKLGDIFATTPEQKNKWKARMLKAGLESKGLEFPEDWESLPEQEKETRMNKVIEALLEKKDKQNPDKKDKASSEPVRLARDNQSVTDSFFQGRNIKSKNRMSKDGSIYSYGTKIAELKNDSLVLNNKKYSVTTSRLQNELRNEAKRRGIPIVEQSEF